MNRQASPSLQYAEVITLKAMNNMIRLIANILFSFFLIMTTTSEVLAARLGGGRSFGSRPSYSQSYQRPATASPGSTLSSPTYSQAQQKNQAVRNTLSQRGGLMGMLGGMALGGLLGAMLFGGAFEHINFMDILLLAGVAFLLFKWLSAKRRAQGTIATPGGYYSPQEDRYAGHRSPLSYSRESYEDPHPAGFDTDILSYKGGVRSVHGRAISSEQLVLPTDFDMPGFLAGAQSAYKMMQEAWDQADLSHLRALTTDKVFSVLQDQIRERGGVPNKTELLKVEIELLEVRDVGSNREATVLFDTLLRELPGASPTQVREVWHFIRPKNSRQPTWFLDGIQQLDD